MRIALTIAGSDSGAGAGIQADLKTFAAHRVYGTTAITAVTAQNTLGVTTYQALPADLVAAQIEAVVSDFGVDAAKTGMLPNAAVVESVKAASDVYAPISGDVLEVNEELAAEPALVNSDAAGKAWFFKLKIKDKSELDGLMDEAAYAKHTA